MPSQDLQTRLNEALAERDRLRQEVEQLKDALRRSGIPLSQPATQDIHKLSSAQNITLFRSLFCGREDVYAERWEGRDGKAGYAPACEKDWAALLRTTAAERKKVHKKTRKLLPLTDEAIKLHLTGKKTVGVFPLLTDETCWFLAADFDKTSWQDDAAAVLASC